MVSRASYIGLTKALRGLLDRIDRKTYPGKHVSTLGVRLLKSELDDPGKGLQIRNRALVPHNQPNQGGSRNALLQRLLSAEKPCYGGILSLKAKKTRENFRDNQHGF